MPKMALTKFFNQTIMDTNTSLLIKNMVMYSRDLLVFLDLELYFTKFLGLIACFICKFRIPLKNSLKQYDPSIVSLLLCDFHTKIESSINKIEAKIRSEATTVDSVFPLSSAIKYLISNELEMIIRIYASNNILK